MKLTYPSLTLFKNQILSDSMISGMGNILRIFFQSSCDSSGSNHDLFIDIQNALPDDEDQTAYNVVNGVLEHSSQMVNDLESYKGATEEIRDAISQPNNDYQQRQTWREVCKFVTVLKRLYEYSQEIENIVPQLLYPLCSGPRTPIEHCQSQQALIKQFAEVLHFTLIFDRLKMKNPAIQNDFSYFRRMLQKMVQEYHEETVEMSMDTANRMSLFYASPTPMLKMLSNATTKFVAENQSIPIENTTLYLSTLANTLKNMISNPKYSSNFTSESEIQFSICVMVGVIILYDHVHPFGAFSKKSDIDVTGAIKVIKSNNLNNKQHLLDALRFSTVHYGDESTPKSVKYLLE
ncbi:Protein FAM49A [Trichoplax sp. H2]|nr:Protein FAM49A [Trichoplax sp. H2]|eukprot:RDD41336.1 Protein FAM49A [Trichoplax sp. H2]